MRKLLYLVALSVVTTLAFASVAMAQSVYTPPDSTVDCSAVEEGQPPGIEFFFVPDAGGCIAEGSEGGGTPNPVLSDFGKVVFDPDTGERLGTVRDLDPDLSSGANSLTYQEFCGSFDGLPERARTAQEYFEQGADAEEQAILDPNGDGLACTAEDTAFLAGDTPAEQPGDQYDQPGSGDGQQPDTGDGQQTTDQPQPPAGQPLPDGQMQTLPDTCGPVLGLRPLLVVCRYTEGRLVFPDPGQVGLTPDLTFAMMVYEPQRVPPRA